MNSIAHREHTERDKLQSVSYETTKIGNHAFLLEARHKNQNVNWIPPPLARQDKTKVNGRAIAVRAGHTTHTGRECGSLGLGGGGKGVAKARQRDPKIRGRLQINYGVSWLDDLDYP